MQKARPSRVPPRGPTPLLLTAAEVDAVYDALQAVAGALTALGVRFVLLAGSLLGAVRSASFLFCDDDADIGIFEEDYGRVLAELPGKLKGVAAFLRRPWPGADRVRMHAQTSVWVDLFVLRRYESEAALRSVLAVKENGEAQAGEYVEGLVGAVAAAGGRFPLRHYDNRKAVELWPREYFDEADLLPLRSYAFGHLRLPGPARPVAYLQRAYGARCFEAYRLATSHLDWRKDSRERFAATGLPAGVDIDLSDDLFLPVQHSRRMLRVWSPHCRATLQAYLAAEASGVPAAAVGIAVAAANPAWLGASLAAATGHSPHAFIFDVCLLEVMEPHVAKARESRRARRAASTLSEAARAGIDSLAFRALSTEADLTYDVSAHDLGAALCASLGLPHGWDLAAFHEHAATQGGKDAVMARLQDVSHRAPFHDAFDAFVRGVVLPSVAATMGDDADAHYQLFPCIRVIQPGEFSLGVHCDTFYGFSPGNVNFVVPLTHSSGAAALHVETSPGREDWHPVTGGPGTLKRFHGSQCLHFTSENTTGLTRVSLDFRVIPACAWDGAHDAYTSRSGYYSRAQRGGPAWTRAEEGPLRAPDARVGYPFVAVRALAAT
jgi:hypothetical protein